MIVLGCDPGKTGAVTIYNSVSQKIVDVIDIKLDHNLVDYQNLYSILSSYNVGAVVFESNLILPHDGKTRLWISAKNYGVIERILTDVCNVNNIELTIVRPANWKRALDLIKKDKNASIALADEYTKNDEVKYFTLKKHHNRAESFLMIKYWEMIQNGDVEERKISSPKKTRRKSKRSI